jgi:hypothetical protein
MNKSVLHPPTKLFDSLNQEFPRITSAEEIVVTFNLTKVKISEVEVVGINKSPFTNDMISPELAKEPSKDQTCTLFFKSKTSNPFCDTKSASMNDKEAPESIKIEQTTE